MAPTPTALHLQVSDLPPPSGGQYLNTSSPSSSHSSCSENRVDTLRRGSDDWIRRHSGSSMSSWESTDAKQEGSKAPNSVGNISERRIYSPSQSSAVVTPDLSVHGFSFPGGFSSSASPAGSVASTVIGQRTPIAERDEPGWPVYAAQPAVMVASSSQHRSTPMDVDVFSTNHPDTTGNASVDENGSLRKRPSYKAPPAPSRLASALDVTGKRISTACQAALSEKARVATEYLRTQSGRPKEVPGDSQSWREFLGLSPTSAAPGEHKVVAASSESGCSITAPLGRESASPKSAPAPSLPVAASEVNAEPIEWSGPRWALPPKKHGRVTSRPSSLEIQRDVEMDFGEDLLRTAGAEGEDFEIIKGSEGRIAVKVTRRHYDIMAWLPGFSVDNITISTKVKGSISIVANRWDTADHATWDIKLGGEADMGSIRARFERGELHVLVSRFPGRGTRTTTPSVVSAPAVLAWPGAPRGPTSALTTPPIAGLPDSLYEPLATAPPKSSI